MGTTPDKVKAHEWFKRAASHNFAPAQHALTQYS
jgi:TPR repeat protein